MFQVANRGGAPIDDRAKGGSPVGGDTSAGDTTNDFLPRSPDSRSRVPASSSSRVFWPVRLCLRVCPSWSECVSRVCEAEKERGLEKKKSRRRALLLERKCTSSSG